MSDTDFFGRLAERVVAAGDGHVRALIPSRFESTPALPTVRLAPRAPGRPAGEGPS